MKKDKTQKRTPVPINLSAKKASFLKHQQLFTPYKIDWKKNEPHTSAKQPLKNAQNIQDVSYSANSNPKIFYENMKSQLLHIKQDVEKMMHKGKGHARDPASQGHTFSSKESDVKTINIKNKCQKRSESIHGLPEYKATEEQKKASMKYDISGKQVFIGESTFKKESRYEEAKEHFSQNSYNQRSKSISNAESLLSSRADNLRMDCSEMVEQRKNIELENQNQKLQVQIKLPSTMVEKDDRFSKESQQFRSLVASSLNRRKDCQKIQSVRSPPAAHDSFEEVERELRAALRLKQDLQAKFKSVSEEKASIHSQLEVQSAKNRENSKSIESLGIQIAKLQENKSQRNSDFHKLNEQIHFLRQKCEEGNQKHHFQRQQEQRAQIQENQKTKEKLKSKQSQLYIYQEELKKAKSKIKELKEEMENHVCESHEEVGRNEPQPLYNTSSSSDSSERQKSLSQKCRRLEEALSTKQNSLREINNLKNQNADDMQELTQSNNFYKQKIEFLEKQIDDYQKAEHKQGDIAELIQSNPSFKNIGEEISEKFSQMVDENYKLKNKISKLESEIQTLKLTSNSLKEEVRLHEEKLDTRQSKSMRIDDWDNLNDECDRLREEKEKLEERMTKFHEHFQLQEMKKDNEIHELKQSIKSLLFTESENESSTLNEQSPYPRMKILEAEKCVKNFDHLVEAFKEMIDFKIQAESKLKQMVVA